MERLLIRPVQSRRAIGVGHSRLPPSAEAGVASDPANSFRPVTVNRTDERRFALLWTEQTPEESGLGIVRLLGTLVIGRAFL